MNEPKLINPSCDGRLEWQQSPSEPCSTVTHTDRCFCIDPWSLRVYDTESIPDPPETSGERPYLGPSKDPKRPLAICLNLCQACNLECRYCYVRNRDKMGGDVMPLKVACQAMHTIVRHQPRISFFGGEPLTQFDLMREVVAYAEDVLAEPRFHVTTNGTLITEEMADFFKEHGFTFIVSLDGPARVHDFNRPAAGGVPSYARTLGGLRALRAAGLSDKVALRSTYTSDCVDLAARVEHLNFLVKQGMADAVAIEPISSSESACVDPSFKDGLISLSDVRMLRDEHRQAFQWIRRELIDGRPVYWKILRKIVERLVNRRPQATECGAGKGYVSVSPDGHLYACHREAGRPIGTVRDGYDEEVRALWSENRFYVRETCPTCWARYVCGGGCRADSLVHMGEIRRPFPVSCMVWKIMTANVIELLSELPRDRVKLIR